MDSPAEQQPAKFFACFPAVFTSSFSRRAVRVYGFSSVVLAHTIRRAVDVIPPERDARVAECVRNIRRYLRWMADERTALDYRDHLREAVSELSVLALEHHEVSLATHLRDIVEQLVMQRLLTINESRTDKATRKNTILRLLLDEK